MVLQQAPAKSAVYGTVAGPSTGKISVTVTPSSAEDAAYTIAATMEPAAGGNSTWKAFLKPTPAGGNYTILAKCMSGCTGDAQIADVTFGEALQCVVVSGTTIDFYATCKPSRPFSVGVGLSCTHLVLRCGSISASGDVWYCSGQSNMALPVLHTFSRNKSRDLVQSGKGADIRIHGLKGNMNIDQVWSTAGAACQGEACSDLFQFSSTCWYFAESLAEKLKPQRPIGLVHTAWGGSMIEAWTLDNVSASCAGMGTSQHLWDTAVVPYLDMSIKGWVWYQGTCQLHKVASVLGFTQFCANDLERIFCPHTGSRGEQLPWRHG